MSSCAGFDMCKVPWLLCIFFFFFGPALEISRAACGSVVVITYENSFFFVDQRPTVVLVHWST